MSYRRRLMMIAAAAQTPVLPYDAELDYIEMTGSQYINTGILVNAMRVGYQYGIEFINDLSGTRTIAGVWEGTYDANHIACLVVGNYTNGYFAIPANWRGGGQPGAASALAAPDEYAEVSLVNNNDWDGSGFTLALTSPLKNETLTFANPYQGSASYPFVIGGCNQKGTIKEMSHIKVHYFRLLEYGAALIDLIPVRVGLVGYMYDRVSGTLFPNAGSGGFTLGPDKGGSYTLIEYVDGDNYATYNAANQILDTGIKGDADDYTFEMDFMQLRAYRNYESYFTNFNGSENYNCWRLAQNGTTNAEYCVNMNTRAGNGELVAGGAMLNERVQVTLSKSSLVRGGTTYALTTTTQGTANKKTIGLGSGRWYYFKTRKNGALIQDLRPARDAQNNLCMVDLVTGKIYHSGYFTNGGQPL